MNFANNTQGYFASCVGIVLSVKPSDEHGIYCSTVFFSCRLFKSDLRSVTCSTVRCNAPWYLCPCPDVVKLCIRE